MYPFFAGIIAFPYGKLIQVKMLFLQFTSYNCFSYEVGGNEHLWLNGVYDSAVVIFFPSNYFLGSERRD
jgi:hypothetical protein